MKGFDVSSEGLAKGFVSASMSVAAEDPPSAADGAAAAGAKLALWELLSASDAGSLCSWGFEELYSGCLPVNSPLRGCCRSCWCCCCGGCWGGGSCCCLF